MLFCINIGTTTGDKIIHLVVKLELNNPAKAIKTVVIATRAIPSKLKLFSKFEIHPRITNPMLDCFQNAKNCE